MLVLCSLGPNCHVQCSPASRPHPALCTASHACVVCYHTTHTALPCCSPLPAQLSMSQLASLTGRAGGATLLHEVMSFLRRCLTQVCDGLWCTAAAVQRLTRLRSPAGPLCLVTAPRCTSACLFLPCPRAATRGAPCGVRGLACAAGGRPLGAGGCMQWLVGWEMVAGNNAH